jgi:hypothetical protein
MAARRTLKFVKLLEQERLEQIEERKRDQQEMNELAENDVEEYNRRMVVVAQKQFEANARDEESKLERRRRLAKERKVLRRERRELVDSLPTIDMVRSRKIAGVEEE